MKFNCTCVLASSLLVIAFSASSSSFQDETNPSTATGPSAMHKHSDEGKGDNLLKLPDHFTPYASESIGDGKRCIVGVTTDDDGLNQRPVAYVAGSEIKRAIWIAPLDPPPNTFQSRATHCNHHGAALFVLLQSDTQPEQTLSQTLLRVVKLDAATGAVQAQRNVAVPKAHTAWVDEGASHFRWQGDVLTISGNYRRQSDQDDQTPFTVHLTHDLNP